MFYKESKDVVVYFSVANFIIKIIFSATHDPFPAKYWIDRIKREYFKWVIEKPNIIDATIYFSPEQFLTGTKHKSIYYLKLFTWKGMVNVVTYYHISHSQFIYILQLILQKLIKKDGFFMHASASQLFKSTCGIFIGKSSAGKSTISHFLNSSFNKIADDVIVIRLIKDHYYLFMLPFDSKLNSSIKQPSNYLQYKISHIFLLKKSANTKFTLLQNNNRILSKLISSLWLFDKTKPNKIIQFISRLISQCKVYQFEFSYDPKKVLDVFNNDIINSHKYEKNCIK